MSKDISTLIEDIKDAVDTGVRAEDLAGPLSEFLINVHAELESRFAIEERKHKATPFELYLSNVGKPSCQLWYQHRAEPQSRDDIPPELRLKFIYGAIIEELMLLLARISGHDVTDEQKKVTFDKIRGKIDCKIDGKVVDVKSASSNAFRKFAGNSVGDDDPFGYIAQLSSYNAVEGDEDSSAYFFVMDKESGNLTLTELDDLDQEVPDISDIKRTIAAEMRVKCFDDEPEGKSGNMALCKTCRYCDFKYSCWADANDGTGLRTFRYSNGPKFLTKVMKEPKVEEIV